MGGGGQAREPHRRHEQACRPALMAQAASNHASGRAGRATAAEGEAKTRAELPCPSTQNGTPSSMLSKNLEPLVHSYILGLIIGNL